MTLLQAVPKAATWLTLLGLALVPIALSVVVVAVLAPALDGMIARYIAPSSKSSCSQPHVSAEPEVYEVKQSHLPEAAACLAPPADFLKEHDTSYTAIAHQPKAAQMAVADSEIWKFPEAEQGQAVEAVKILHPPSDSDAMVTIVKDTIEGLRDPSEENHQASHSTRKRVRCASLL